MKYNRNVIGDNIGFSTIVDEKFKTSSLTINFIIPLTKETSALNSLAMRILTTTNSQYRTIADMCRKLSALYGASISSFTGKRGDVQVLGIKASWINNRYAIDGEDIRSEMLGIVKDCLFCPNAENGEFDAESFRIAKKETLDSIDAELNNKRGYAIQRASELAFEGEPAANPIYGTRTEAEAATSAAAFEAYQKLMKTAQIEMYYITAEDDDSVENTMKESFASVERDPVSVTFRAPSAIRSETAEKSETFDVRQCKMVLTFKTDTEDRFALKMLSLIFGETTVSKLFKIVREKMSLCYYCASRTVFQKGALMVDSGVERGNIEKARNAIIAQLDEIRKGNISDEEIESSLLTVDNALSQIGDTASSYANWFFERFCDNSPLETSEYFMDFKNVTKARIVQAANSLKLDSVYLMLDKEDNA